MQPIRHVKVYKMKVKTREEPPQRKQYSSDRHSDQKSNHRRLLLRSRRHFHPYNPGWWTLQVSIRRQSVRYTRAIVALVWGSDRPTWASLWILPPTFSATLRQSGQVRPHSLTKNCRRGIWMLKMIQVYRRWPETLSPQSFPLHLPVTKNKIKLRLASGRSYFQITSLKPLTRCLTKWLMLCESDQCAEVAFSMSILKMLRN